MATLDLKKSVHNAVDHADDRLLRMIKAVVESYQEGEIDHAVTQKHKEILDDRLKNYRENPNDLLDWEEVKEDW